MSISQVTWPTFGQLDISNENRDPLKYHPTDGFDWARRQPEFVAKDDTGQFVWVYAIILASVMAEAQLHAGMNGFPVRMAYVIDNTVGHDVPLIRCCGDNGAMSDDGGGLHLRQSPRKRTVR
jgi:hypothetical protein